MAKASGRPTHPRPSRRRTDRFGWSGGPDTGRPAQHWLRVMCNSIERVTTGTVCAPYHLDGATIPRARTHVQGVPTYVETLTHRHTRARTHAHTRGSQLESQDLAKSL